MSNDDEQTADEFAREFLLGELIKSATNRFRYLEKPFLSMAQREQETVLGAVKDDIKRAVRQAVQVIASDNRVTFLASCDQVAFKSDGVKAQLSMVNSKTRTRSLMQPVAS
jgi:Zn-dependent M16 (insulinase) family peptidase